jgi:hypothetical protein
MAIKSFELVIASESKPFPWGPLATTIYINSTCDGNPITITTQAVALLEPAVQASNAKLISKSESFPPRFLVIYSAKTETGAAICNTLAIELSKARLWTSELAEVIEFTLLGSIEKLISNDQASISEALAAINENMTFSMHPVKYAFTVVDLLLWGAIKANPHITADILSGKYPEIERWYKEFMEQQPIVTQVNKFIHQNNAAVWPLKYVTNRRNLNPRQQVSK